MGDHEENDVVGKLIAQMTLTVIVWALVWLLVAFMADRHEIPEIVATVIAAPAYFRDRLVGEAARDADF